VDTRKLEKGEWRAYFDVLTKGLAVGKRVEIEVAAIPLGDQIEAEWLPLLGMTYDHKDDSVHVFLAGGDAHLDHIIRHPSEIWVTDGKAGVESILVVGSDGARQIVKLRDPLMLPAPSETA
jgi:hypothetical protein